MFFQNKELAVNIFFCNQPPFQRKTGVFLHPWLQKPTLPRRFPNPRGAHFFGPHRWGRTSNQQEHAKFHHWFSWDFHRISPKGSHYYGVRKPMEFLNGWKNGGMESKYFFRFNWMIFRFHVNFRGCAVDGSQGRPSTWFWENVHHGFTGFLTCLNWSRISSINSIKRYLKTHNTGLWMMGS